jgi:hypothetical protein
MTVQVFIFRYIEKPTFSTGAFAFMAIWTFPGVRTSAFFKDWPFAAPKKGLNN